MKTLAITLSLLFTFCIISAGAFPVETENETETESDKGVITGQIIDQKTSEPISYASVALINESDMTVVTGVITDEEGKFILNDVPDGKYTIKISFIGYKTTEIKEVIINRKSRKINLETTGLSEEAKKLEEVVITEERLKGEEKIDRTVFTLNDDIRNTSSSGLDALKHIPSVTVDFQENVTLEGQSDIQFYVDGVLRNKNFVAQLDPRTIDKIEVMTNPSVKYDADISGIINFVLKKEKRFGFNGMVKVPVSNPKTFLANPEASLEYGNRNFRLYAADRLHFEKFSGKEFLSTEVDDTYGQPYYNNRVGKGKNQWRFNFMNYGIDWFLSDKSSLNLYGEWTNFNGVGNNFLFTNSRYEDNAMVSYFESLRDNDQENNSHVVSLFYKQKMNKEGNELTAEAYYQRQHNTSFNDFVDSYFSEPEFAEVDNTIFRTEKTDNLKNTAEFKLDYTFLWKNVKNEAGIRAYSHWMDNDFTNNYVIEQVPSEVDDNFKYQETRQVAYYNISGKVKKWTWQAGVRAENSDIDIDETTSTGYFTLLPQFNVNYSLKENQSLKLSYRRRIFRPSIEQLNPFVTWIDSLHYRAGNPDLDPALENRFELTYTTNIGSNYVSPKAYLRFTENGIADISEITDDGITSIGQANIGKNYEYGVALNTSVQLLKFWRFNGNMAVFNQEVSSDQNWAVSSKEERTGYRVGLTNIFFLPKNFALVAVAFYNSPTINYQRVFSRDFLFILGGEKTFSEKAKLEFFYNPFIKDFTYAQVETRAPGYEEHWKGVVNVQHLFNIEFTYRFSFGGKVKKLDRSTEYETEGGGGLF